MAYRAVFNPEGLDSLAALEPSALVLEGTVTTSVGRPPEPIVEEYRFPDLDGRGSVKFGLDAADIFWRVEIHDSPQARTALENLIRTYQRTGRQYPLWSEHGDVWSYCELRGYSYLEPVSPVVGGAQYAVLRVHFRDLQPGTVGVQA